MQIVKVWIPREIMEDSFLCQLSSSGKVLEEKSVKMADAWDQICFSGLEPPFFMTVSAGGPPDLLSHQNPQQQQCGSLFRERKNIVSWPIESASGPLGASQKVALIPRHVIAGRHARCPSIHQ